MTFPLPVRTIADDPTEHVSDHTLLHRLYNGEANAQGPRVINVLAPPPAVSSVAAVGNGSVDDNVAIQNILDYVANGTDNWVWFPYRNTSGNVAQYLTSKPLKVWNGTHIMGPATIAPTATFDWVNHPYWQDPLFNPVGIQQPGDIALLELWNPTVGSGRGAFSRIFLEDLAIDCKAQAGSIGLLTKLQQPAYTFKLRIDNATIGWVLWGQDCMNSLTDIFDVGVGVYLGSPSGNFDGFTKIMTFYKLNVEDFTEAAVRANCEGPNYFFGVHIEGPTSATVFDMQNGIFHVENGLSSVAGTIFKIGDMTPIPGPKSSFYSIKNWQVNSSDGTYTQLMLDDRVAGQTRVVGYARRWHEISRLFQNDTSIDYDAHLEWMSEDGGTVRIGGIKGGTAAPPGHSGAQFTVRPNVNQDEPMVRFHDSSHTLRSGIGQKGDLFLGSYTTAARPTSVPLYSMIFDTTLNKPVWNTASGVWRDAAGTIV